MDYEDKLEDARDIIRRYQNGFITVTELIMQLHNIPWNPLEMMAISKMLTDTINVNIGALELSFKFATPQKSPKLKKTS